ncbi:MAG: SIS domain-containing protein, partial [bacterium]
MTSIANDLSFDKVFLQQARGLLRPGDLFWVISTSGNSKNLTEAVEWANKNGISTVGLLGKDGGRLAPIVEIPIIVQGENTQRIQEVHIIVLHILASALKTRYKNGL